MKKICSTPIAAFLLVLFVGIMLQAFLVTLTLLKGVNKQPTVEDASSGTVQVLMTREQTAIAQVPLKRQRLVWFLHFHKAAGTSFTDLAWKNNERVLHQNYLETASTDPHGHLELDTKRKLKWDLVWPGRPSNDSCDFDPQSVQEEQSRLLQQEFSLLKQHNITFASTEHWFPPLEVMDQHYDQATFAVLIREPMERLVSSFHFHLSGANRCPSGQRKCSFGDWAPAESNMHVKMLNGIPFGPLKVGKPCAREMFTFTITSEQYQIAAKSLEKFHVVLTLQSVKEHPEQVACILQKALGWNVTSLPKKNTKRKRIQQRYIQKEELEQARLDNKWDLELYKRARELEQDLFAKLGCVW